MAAACDKSLAHLRSLGLVRAACIALLSCSTAAAQLPESLPWNLAALQAPPAVEWLDDDAPVRSLLYAGEPYKGKSTRVFAYYATPASIAAEPEAEPGGQPVPAGPWPGSGWHRYRQDRA